MESDRTASKSSLSQYWNDIDWNALRRLRARFLEFDASTSASEDYWRSESDLRNYDLTFAERIGWKWDAVLGELAPRGWAPPKGTMLDWGCGSGVAGRRVVGQWPEACEKLLLWDRSRRAMHYSQDQGRAAFPGTVIEKGEATSHCDTLILSHVLNELSAKGVEDLIALVSKAQVVLWVEPGTAAVSRKLIEVRERLLAAMADSDAGTVTPIGPCTHAAKCGLLDSKNERHWCHHFAKPPGEIFQDGAWTKFAQMAEIDLRSVPFSTLVLDRRPEAASFHNPELARVLGEPRLYKGFQKVLSCQAAGVEELTLQKRDAPELFKAMKKECGTLYQWQRDGEKIRSGERIV